MPKRFQCASHELAALGCTAIAERRQFIEHEPGPRGSPQAPHGVGRALSPSFDELAPTAKTESCLSSAVPWHSGHSSTVCSRTRSSNRCSQPRH
jgi:hypothetical protein